MSHHISYLTSGQIKRIAPSSLVVLPVGAVEQHGLHLPLCTDYSILDHITSKVCEKIGNNFPVLTCPMLPYGSSHHHLPSPTLSLSNTTYIAVIKDIVESLVISGFKKIFILNGHGGNENALKMCTQDLAKKYNIFMATASYWDLAMDRLLAYLDNKEIKLARIPGHAGDFETSLMLAINKNHVLMDQRPAGIMSASDKINKRNIYVKKTADDMSIFGYSDNAINASKSLGEGMLDIIIEETAQTIIETFF